MQNGTHSDRGALDEGAPFLQGGNGLQAVCVVGRQLNRVESGRSATLACQACQEHQTEDAGVAHPCGCRWAGSRAGHRQGQDKWRQSPQACKQLKETLYDRKQNQLYGAVGCSLPITGLAAQPRIFDMRSGQERRRVSGGPFLLPDFVSIRNVVHVAACPERSTSAPVEHFKH